MKNNTKYDKSIAARGIYILLSILRQQQATEFNTIQKNMLNLYGVNISSLRL